MGINLPLLWAFIISFGVIMYVLSDGFDLGIGILFPLIPEESFRNIAMNTVAPIWDGNETWLVLGGAGLFAAFPLVYSVVLSGLYIPLLFMLLGLIFRGVAFEFRFKAKGHKRHIWDKSFICGSFITTFFQGVALGAIISGMPVKNNIYAGGVLDWLSPFPLATGVGLVLAYALLGSSWLVMKTEGDLQSRMFFITRRLSWVLFFSVVLISIWSLLRSAMVIERWFSYPNVLLTMPVPAFVVVAMFLMQRSINRQSHIAPFLYTLVLMILGFIGLLISGWPYILPPEITIWEAASSPESMGFTLVGALFIVPIILMYTGFTYYAFRGKVKHGQSGYH